MSTSVAHPIQLLRQHSTNFEAALSVCLADPKVRAVHKLRTESRRLEAQIALLKLVSDLPPFRTEAAKALLQIKRVRQAAGRVRDLDVQCEHLENHNQQLRTGALPESEKQLLIADVEKMRATRAERRTVAAAKLVAEIGARQEKAAAALEKLNSALKHVSQKKLASAELLALTQRQFARTRALKRRKPSADDLHTVRKAAKQARYLAENAGAKSAAAAAKRYEHIQELGGAWHDWLELTSSARRELGKTHATAGQFRELRDRHLASYREELAKLTVPANNKLTRPVKAKKAARA